MASATMPSLTKRGGTHKRSLAPVHGTVKWVGYFEPSMLRLGVAMLHVRTEKGVETTYFVRRLEDGEGRLTGYLLTEVEGPRPGAVYELDCTFGPEREHWACDCPDWRENRRYRPVSDCSCKHVKGLHASLRRVGLI